MKIQGTKVTCPKSRMTEAARGPADLSWHFAEARSK